MSLLGARDSSTAIYVHWQLLLATWRVAGRRFRIRETRTGLLLIGDTALRFYRGWTRDPPYGNVARQEGGVLLHQIASVLPNHHHQNITIYVRAMEAPPPTQVHPLVASRNPAYVRSAP